MALEVAIFTDVFVRKMPLPATDQSPLLVIVRPTALEIVTPLLNVAVPLNCFFQR